MKRLGNKSNKLRLQVFLSRNGVCSRRKAFDWIMDGRVSVNGRVVREPSTPVDATKDQVFCDGKRIVEETYAYVLFNKPRGVVTTRADRFAEKTVFDLLPAEFRRLVPVGRLDKDTEGLLLLTNDGDLTYKITHPKFDIDKTYEVRLAGKLDARNKTRVEKGVVVDGRKTSPAKIEKVAVRGQTTDLAITIHEGRKRQVRRMFAVVGHKVLYLKRLTQGPLALGTLKTGRWRELTAAEVTALKNL